MFDSLKLSVISFIRINYFKIIIAVVISAIGYLIFYLSTYSLKKLKVEIFQSYPFNLFFPEGGSWSIGYFLLIIILLGALIFFELKGNFLAGPA